MVIKRTMRTLFAIFSLLLCDVGVKSNHVAGHNMSQSQKNRTHHHYNQDAVKYLFERKKCISCTELLVHIDTFSLPSLEHALSMDSIQLNPTNSTIIVLRSKSLTESIEHIGRVLDFFTSSRPWWIVDTESYHWFPWMKDVILYHVPMTSKHIFEAISHQNFLSLSACASAPLQASTHIFDAWGNRLLNVEIEWSSILEAVFAVYVSQEGNPAKDVGFIEADSCPFHVNKWTCIFLQTTNCTLPHQLTSCRHIDCMPSGSESQLYTNASSKGRMVLSSEKKNFVDAIRSSIKPIEGLITTDCVKLVGYKALPPYTIIDKNSSILSRNSCNIRSTNIVFTRGFMFRFNANYRARVRHRMFVVRMESSPPFLPTAQCTAAHVRMDDRTLPGVDMVAYCNNHTTVDEKGQRKFNSTSISESVWYDYGCDAPIPFGAITIDFIVNASLVLQPNNRNLYIMTDDRAWLQRQLYSYNLRNFVDPNDKFTIFTFPAGADHRKPSAAATVDFWASVALAQQCEAFVGHFASASTSLVFNSMCYRHAYSTFLQCPPAYDVGGLNF